MVEPTPTTVDSPLTEATRPLRRNGPYLLLMSGKTTQLLGAGIGAFAVPLVAYEVTGDVWQAGVISGIGQIGAVLAALPAGVIADHFDRRRVLFFAAAVGAAVWTGTAAAGLFGRLTGMQLAATLFVSSMIGSIIGPTETSMIRTVVARDQMAGAMAAVQGRSAATSLLSGPLGGVLYGLSHSLPLLGSAVGHLVLAICAHLLRTPNTIPVEKPAKARPVKALQEGLAYTFGSPLFRAVLILGPFLNLITGALLTAINLELIRTGTDPLAIGLIDAVAGCAMLAGSLAAGPIVGRIRAGVLQIVALTTIAVCTAAMAVWPTYGAYIVLVAVAVIPLPASNAAVSGYTIAITPEALQGRFSSAIGLSSMIGAPLAPVLAAGMLGSVGIAATLWTLAIAMVVGVCALSSVKDLWRIGLPGSWIART